MIMKGRNKNGKTQYGAECSTEWKNEINRMYEKKVTAIKWEMVIIDILRRTHIYTCMHTRQNTCKRKHPRTKTRVRYLSWRVSRYGTRSMRGVVSYAKMEQMVKVTFGKCFFGVKLDWSSKILYTHLKYNTHIQKQSNQSVSYGIEEYHHQIVLWSHISAAHSVAIKIGLSAISYRYFYFSEIDSYNQRPKCFVLRVETFHSMFI